MTNYAKGRRAEWAVRDVLYHNGAKHVIRSAGSKSEADLVAAFPHRVYFLQVKTYKPTKQEMVDCFEASIDCAGIWVAVHWESAKCCGAWAWKGGKPYKVLPPGLQEPTE